MSRQNRDIDLFLSVFLPPSISPSPTRPLSLVPLWLRSPVGLHISDTDRRQWLLHSSARLCNLAWLLQAPSHRDARARYVKSPYRESTYIYTYIYTPTTTTGSRIMARRDPRIRPCLIVPSRYKLTGVLLSFSPPFPWFRFYRASLRSFSLSLSLASRSWGGRKVKGRSTRVVSFPPRRCSVRTNSWLVRISTGTAIVGSSPDPLCALSGGFRSSGRGRICSPRIYFSVIFSLDL